MKMVHTPVNLSTSALTAAGLNSAQKYSWANADLLKGILYLNVSFLKNILYLCISMLVV